MEKIRGFEIISAYENKNIHLPQRATKDSAGYDIEAAEDVVIPSLFKTLEKGESQPPVLVPTGLKVYMPQEEYLILVSRSSNSMKRFLSMPNAMGIIDADYYNSPANEGHLYFQFINFGLEDVVIKKGERIGQGIFQKYERTDNDQAQGKRTGGFGSSGK